MIWNMSSSRLDLEVYGNWFKITLFFIEQLLINTDLFQIFRYVNWWLRVIHIMQQKYRWSGENGTQYVLTLIAFYMRDW